MALQTPYTALKRFVVLVLMAGLFPILSWGQANLVPNPSFEEYDHCSSSGQGLGWADDWTVPDQGYSPDYFNVCSQVSPMSVPENVRGIQEPVSGNGYIGLVSLESPSTEVRDAITCQLLSSLAEGQTYVFKMFVSLSDFSSYQISTVGYKLSHSPLSGPTPIVEYEATYSSTTPLADKENWMVVTDTVVAQGGEQYLTIANFMSDAMSDSVYVGNGTNGDRSYYYIDDVSLVPLDSLLSVHDTEKVEALSVYPSPSDGVFTVNVPICQGQKAPYLLSVSDVTGKTVFDGRMACGQRTLNLGNLDNGTYLLRVASMDGIERWHYKLLILH